MNKTTLNTTVINKTMGDGMKLLLKQVLRYLSVWYLHPEGKSWNLLWRGCSLSKTNDLARRATVTSLSSEMFGVGKRMMLRCLFLLETNGIE